MDSARPKRRSSCACLAVGLAARSARTQQETVDLLNRAQTGSTDMVRETLHLDAVVREASANRPP